MKVTEFTPGRFCWHELGTADDVAAKAFYENFFGWKIAPSTMMDGAEPSPDGPDGTGMTYWMIELDGEHVGGAYNLPPNMLEMGVPPHWMSYVGVESADATAARVKGLGGKVQMGPMDVFDLGRMAVLQDPLGATFAIWEEKKHGGHGVCSEVGSVCWNELLTSDREKAASFYGDLFGWKQTTMEMGPVTYTMMSHGGEDVCGIMKAPPEMGAAPPSWMVYFAVGDTDEQVELCKSLGGQVLGPPQDIPGIGRMAMMADGQGAGFAIIRMAAKKR